MNERIQMLAFDILRRAIDKPEAERQSFVREECDADAALLREVESLLHSHSRAGQFLSAATAGVESATDSPCESPGTRIGRYELVKLIGEGGFGSVFRARQEYPVRREVALKVIKLGMDTKQVIARFEAERQALAMMEHPNIARVFDAGATETGRPYFVMELVDGVPVTRYCDDNKLTVRERLDLFVSVCQAVQHAHTKGVIHRDLKPSNILVALNDGIAVPKVIDFGIAKAVQGRLTDQTLMTEDRQWVGTPQYMSPEQADGGGDVDTRSDIYTLGVLFYELLTGTTPLGGGQLRSQSFPEIHRRVPEIEPPKPSTRLSTLQPVEAEPIAANRRTDAKRLTRMVRGELDWIVLKALEKDRTHRYQTANGLARDVQRQLNGEPVEASPPSRTYRVRKFARKNRVALGTVTGFILILAAATVVSSWQAIRATREAKLALQQDTEARIAKFHARSMDRYLRRLLTSGEPGDADQWYRRLRVILEDDVREVSAGIGSADGRGVDAGPLLAARARLCQRLGNFQQALADVRAWVEIAPNNHQAWYQLACLQLYLGHERAYRESCAQMLRRFSEVGKSADFAGLQVSDRIAKACLAGEGVKDLELITRFADQNVARRPPEPAEYFLPFLQLAKGMAEYRKGADESAAVWLNRSRDGFAAFNVTDDWIERESDNTVDGQVTAAFFIAMAEYRERHDLRAREALALARDELRKLVPQPSIGSPRFGTEDWLIVQIAAREAETLFGHDAAGHSLHVQSALR